MIAYNLVHAFLKTLCLSPAIWRTKTFNQAFDLLLATATAHGGIGLFFDFFHGGGAINDGIDNIHFYNLVTDTEILVQILFKNRRKFIQWVGMRIGFQDVSRLFNQR